MESEITLADLIIYGGNIITMDVFNAMVDAVAIKAGKIIATGSKKQVLEMAGKETSFVKLQANQTLLPGFIEPHQHAINLAMGKCLYVTCSAYYYHSYDEIKTLLKSMVAAPVDTKSDQRCILFGWDPEMLSDLPKLNFDVLDGFSTTIPIVVIGQSGHVSWGNRKAFEVAGITEDVVDPSEGTFVRDPATGKLTGQMLENPTLYKVLPVALKVDTVTSALNQQWKEYATAGFTTVTELFYKHNHIIHPLLIEKSQSTDCPIRVALYQVDVPNLESKTDLPENDKLWIAGIKLMGDGSPHCGTAAVDEEYLHNELTDTLGFPPAPNYGKLNYKRDGLLARVRYWHDKGEQVAIHANGERAIKQSLDVLEEVQHCSPRKDVQHRLEHLGLCEEKHIKKAVELDVSLSFFVQQLYFYASSYKNCIIGPERTNRWAPIGLATKHNALWTLHQDHPSFPGQPEPFANLMTAVTRTERYKPETVYGPEYCITIEEALKGYTINAAKQIHKDKELGSLTVGKQADLVILSDNPLKVDPFKLVDIKVLDTYLDGRSNGISERKESIHDGKLVYSY